MVCVPSRAFSSLLALSADRKGWINHSRDKIDEKMLEENKCRRDTNINTITKILRLSTEVLRGALSCLKYKSKL